MIYYILRKMSIAALVLLSAVQVQGATQAQVDQARAKGLAWLMTHQNGDGNWQAAPGLEVQSTATALDAFMNAGIYRGYSFGAAVNWLQNANSSSIDSLSRKIVTLAGAGTSIQTDFAKLVSLKNWPYSATWGAYAGYDTSFPDTPLAQAAVRTANYWYPNLVSSVYPSQVYDLSGAVYCNILPSQQTAGGWPYVEARAASPNSAVAAIVPTAYTLLELQQTYNNNPWDTDSCDGTTNTPSYSLSNAITKGVAWLLAKKNSDGGFGDNGTSTILETALAYQVLTLVNSTDPAKGAALDFLISRQNTDGSWQTDSLQTALVLKAFNAVTMTDTDADGIPDAVEAILGTNPLVADGRNLVIGNGQSVSGVTAPTFIASATINRFFSTTLTAGGGTPPYSWGLVAGSLPTGLGLNGATGAISGTPGEMGAFNFTYSISDSAGGSTSTNGQISVDRAPVRTTLPVLQFFGSLQDAYSGQSVGSTAAVQAMGGTFTGDLTCDKDVTITFSGGFDDTFSNQTGTSVLNGTLTIIGGTVYADKLVIQ